MILTVNRRFRFCASRRLARDAWSREENERVYGAGGEGPWGAGENYQVRFVFAGEVNPRTGLLVNLSEVKAAVGPIIETRYDHRYLNLDTPPFDVTPPTVENVARRLLEEVAQATRGVLAPPVACHLTESATGGATAYGSGGTERALWISFSAARRTWSPHLSQEENTALFGRAASPSGHGHGYTLRAELAGPVDGSTGAIVAHARATAALASFHERVDHRNLNEEVPELADSPMTTETLARFAFCALSRELPVARVRLHETPDFFAEYDGERFSLGLERCFSAAHRLSSPLLSDAENSVVYGRCANANGHGHRYAVEATVSAPLDERSGTVFGLVQLDEALRAALAPWHQRHLDREVEEFRTSPSTGENLVSALWPRLASSLEGKLTRLRLVETENNRFTARVGPEP